jgi:YHS domain-containing protein
MSSVADLEQRLASEIETARNQVRAIQNRAEQSFEATRSRFRVFLKVARQIRKLARARLEVLARKIPMEGRPSIVRSRNSYHLAIACHVPSELAQVKLRFALGHDADLQNLSLDYELDVLPVYLRFAPREHLDLPVADYREETVARWLDDRIVDFARVFLQIPLTEQYQRDHMVVDPVANISFPRGFARMTLKHDGRTYYFISDETCWEFERKHGIGAE